jgi:DNA-binding CsgD family transcriptional regulator
MSEDVFLDRLYEAAVLPELWPGVLDSLNDQVDVAASVLLGIRGTEVRWTSSASFEDVAITYFQRGYQAQDERTARLVAAGHAGFLCDLDVFTLEEWEANPIRRDLLVPAGFGWGVATTIQVPNGDMLVVHGERRHAAGPPEHATVRRLDALRPHLARALLLSSRLAFQQLAAAADALEIVGIPAAVLGRGGRVLAANHLLSALAPDIVQLRASRLALSSPMADAQLVRTLDGLTNPAMAAAVQSIAVPGTNGLPPSIVHLYPLRRQARDFFSGASAICLVTEVTRREVPPAAIVQGLFDLTAAEARIARGIGQGLTVEELSHSNQVSLATVRTQLKAVFEKTGTKRQSELAGLLQGVGRRPAR